MIRQRTREGLRLRMKLGILLGRPPGSATNDELLKLAPYKQQIKDAIEWGASIRSIAKKVGCDRNTIHRYLMRWGIRCDEKAYEEFKKKEQRYRNERRKCTYKDSPFCIVELPHDSIVNYILDDLTIPQIAEKLPNFTYEQIYDTILCTPEYNTLYRSHGQLKIKKKK